MVNDRFPLFEECANRIYEAVRQAEVCGFRVTLDKYGHVDLFSPETDEHTPLIAVNMPTEESK